jgi:hypothetical protein
MPNPTHPNRPSPPAWPVYSPLAGFLSYLVPGLGQIIQGRISKGVFFLVSLYGLFFCGMHLGSWKNVYLPDGPRDTAPAILRNMGPWVVALWNRPQYLGQFWMGVVAWPALWHYNQHALPARDLGKSWQDFEKAPDERLLCDLQANGDKTWDLGWVYTVIAGVLNVLVIYDAFAGPAFGKAPRETTPAESVTPTRAGGLAV